MTALNKNAQAQPRLLAVFSRLKKFVITHRRALAVLALFTSAAAFATGLTRLFDYSLPMASEHYSEAATYKSRYIGPPSEAPPLPELGEDVSAFDRAIIWVLDHHNQYVDAAVGSRALAAFNQGLELYQDHQKASARVALQKAFAACCDADGKVLSGYELLASDIQLLIGNTLVDEHKDEDAIAAYEASLTLNPNNIVTTYNLEKLQDATGGGGGSDKKDKDAKPQPQGPVSPKRRI